MKRYLTACAIIKLYAEKRTISYDDAVILLKARAHYSQEDIDNLLPIYKRQRERLDRDEYIASREGLGDYSCNSTMNHVQQGL